MFLIFYVIFIFINNVKIISDHKIIYMPKDKKCLFSLNI